GPRSPVVLAVATQHGVHVARERAGDVGDARGGEAAPGGGGGQLGRQAGGEREREAGRTNARAGHGQRIVPRMALRQPSVSEVVEDDPLSETASASTDASGSPLVVVLVASGSGGRSGG